MHWWQSGLLSLVNIKSAHPPLPLPLPSDTLVTGMSIRAPEVSYRVANTSVGSFSEDDKLLLLVSQFFLFLNLKFSLAVLLGPEIFRLADLSPLQFGLNCGNL